MSRREFLTTAWGGGIKLALIIVAIVFCTMIFLPFFEALNRQDSLQNVFLVVGVIIAFRLGIGLLNWLVDWIKSKLDELLPVPVKRWLKTAGQVVGSFFIAFAIVMTYEAWQAGDVMTVLSVVTTTLLLALTNPKAKQTQTSTDQ